jgi:hypothetical protein
MEKTSDMFTVLRFLNPFSKSELFSIWGWGGVHASENAKNAAKNERIFANIRQKSNFTCA